MKHIINIKSNNISKLVRTFIILISFGVLYSCENNILPETGSIPDLTPPKAMFSATESAGSYLTFDFSNQSVSATTYAWNFGDGKSSTDKDPSNTYAGEGTFTVTLIASDKLGITSNYSSVVKVVKPIVIAATVPVILNPSFDEAGTDSKYTIPWVDTDLGKTIQISSSSSFVGGRSAKFPNADTDPRIGYQKDIEVSPNTDYVITYFYSIETGGASSVTVAVLKGAVTSPSQVAGATLGTFTGTNQGGKSDFKKVDINFNSGNNSKISIHISNTGTSTAYVEEIGRAHV